MPGSAPLWEYPLAATTMSVTRVDFLHVLAQRLHESFSFTGVKG
jgi:hypothetical protein